MSLGSPYSTHNSLGYLNIDVFKVNPLQNKYNVVPKIFGLSKMISQIVHQFFGQVSLAILWRIWKIKGS